MLPEAAGRRQHFQAAHGTNQIAGFREFRPLTSQEKNKFSYGTSSSVVKCVGVQRSSPLFVLYKSLNGL